MTKIIKKFFHYILPIVADFLLFYPGKKMVIIGVTGTKGKSTTCRLIASVLESGGFKVGLMTTVEFQIGEKHWPNNKKMSMLGRGKIQWMLFKMALAGCEYAVIETSSEGIMQYRHFGVHYDVAVFTNLGTEHSERHGGFVNLKRDKGKLFAGLKKEKNKKINGKKILKIIVANSDDENADYFLSFDSDKKIEYGATSKTALGLDKKLVSTILSSDGKGTVFSVGEKKYRLNLVGEFNVYNALAAIAVAESQGLEYEKIYEGLKEVVLVEGRMEFIEMGQKFSMIVDYAHEPLSLSALFKTLRHLVGEEGKIISVIGSDGGGRDRGKRYKMGEVAGSLTDKVIITDVNCFDENPREIAEMLGEGARATGKKDGENLFVIIDRREAIKKAVSLAGEYDVVVITAKGTEPCMVVGGGMKIPWDDRGVAREILREVVLQNDI